MTDPSPIRVLLAEDEQPLRDAIRDLIESESGMTVVGTAADAEEAIRLAATTLPDVAVVDVRMPGGGPAAVRGICQCSPDTSVLGLSAYEDHATVVEMLRSGAVGYLVKGISPIEILDAVRRAQRGQASLSVEMTRAVIGELAVDLGGRGQADEAREANEERFRRLLESAPDAAIVVDDRGTIVLVNEQTERLFGYAREDLVGRPLGMLMPEEVREHHAEHRARYFADPVTRPMGVGLELAGRRKDGSEFPVDISLSAVMTDEGMLATAFVRDITQRRQIEERRRGERERLGSLLDSAPDAAVIVDESGEIVLVNTQTERLFGYAREELIGANVEILLPESLQERHANHRARYLGEPVTRPMGIGLELAGQRKDGSQFPVDISLSSIETDEGRLAIAFVRDITERRRSEELERDLADRRSLLAHLVAAAEDERARIADDIHDDSIQVLTAAGMRLQILRRSVRDAEQLERLDDFERTIQLAIARLRHLLFELRPPVLDSDGLSAALQNYLEEAHDETGGTRYRLDDRLRTQPSVQTRTILYRIVQEALVNIRKHAEAANVVVALKERDHGYSVTVEDDGVGFDPNGAAGIVRGHLGLRAMQERATLAGGRLTIDTMPGQGTRVEVWVPQNPGEPYQPADPTIVARPASLDTAGAP